MSTNTLLAQTTRCLCMQGKCVGAWNLNTELFSCARVADLHAGIPPEVAQFDSLAAERDRLREINAELHAALDRCFQYLERAFAHSSEYSSPMMEQARAALAKAKGE